MQLHFVLRGIALCVVMLMAIPARAQQRDPQFRTNIQRDLADGRLPDRDTLNANTVTIVTAPVGGAFAAMGSDMANVLDDTDNLRILPIIGKGSVQNLIDIMRLRNVDMGFVVSDAIEFVKTEYAVPNIERQVQYIAKLFNNDLHIVARKEINSIYDLQGKKIFSERNLGYFSLRNLFNRLHISADVDFKTDDRGGLQKTLSGEADAWIVSAGKVAPIVRSIPNDAGKFHLVPVPYDSAIQDVYLPSSLTNAEYPNLVAPGEIVPTVAASTLLMVYNWPADSERYARVAKFVDALFSKIDQLQQPMRHPKWRETSISATVPGLQRFKAAEDWLQKQRQFEQFMHENASALYTPEQRALLYRQFQEWLRTRSSAR